MGIFELLELNHERMINAANPLDRKQVQFNAEINAEEMKQLIDLNYKGNRDLNRPTFRKYVRAMNLNRWVLNPESLVFAKEGGSWVLMNGNHRGNAQVETGKTNEYSVFIVRSTDIYKTLDQGKIRTPADIIGAHTKIIMPIQYLLRSASFISHPMADDVQNVLNSRIGELLSEVEYHIKPPRKAGSVWKQTGFKAAYVMAVMTNRISYEKAYDIYETIVNNEIKEWPDVFLLLYRQIMEKSISINTSGRSLDNDFFMRGVFAFENHELSTDRLAIHNSFRKSVKEDVFEIMKNFIPQEEREAA